jgi:aldose 1-epimerase
MMGLCLHDIGGHRGFNKVIWTVKEKGGGDFPYITLYYHSFDGEEGT